MAAGFSRPRRSAPTASLTLTGFSSGTPGWGRSVALDGWTITVDPDQGALHEVGGRLEVGPPKTLASARTVHLPPFLVELLTDHRTSCQDGRFVFTGVDGGLLRRSNFRRRTWHPAVAGDPARMIEALLARWPATPLGATAPRPHTRPVCGQDQLLPPCSHQRRKPHRRRSPGAV